VGKIIYTSYENLGKLDQAIFPDPDPTLIAEVEKAMARLSRFEREIAIQRYYRGLTIPAIVAENRIPEKEVKSALYKIRTRLRNLLANFVFDRWGLKCTGLCPICVHPQKEIIELELRKKSDSENWGEFARRLEQLIGVRINPPSIFLGHLKHLMRDDFKEVENDQKN
jgi:hypothetical protein